MTGVQTCALPIYGEIKMTENAIIRSLLSDVSYSRLTAKQISFFDEPEPEAGKEEEIKALLGQF